MFKKFLFSDKKAEQLNNAIIIVFRKDGGKYFLAQKSYIQHFFPNHLYLKFLLL